MAGLIDVGSVQLCFAPGGIIWLTGGLGGPGFDDPNPPSESTMITEAGSTMITEASSTMITE